MPRTALILCRLAPVLLLLALAGCGEPPPVRVSVRWAVGQAPPAFDPDGPPDPVAWTFLRLMGRGLVEMDTSGRVVPAAAERFEVSPDGRRVVFHLREWRFADGTPCVAEDFARALRAALGRRDHSTARWLLAAVEGVEAIRPGRTPPALGIETPDPRTLVLRLARPDPRLPEKLTVPGLGMPWRAAGPDSGWNSGIGPYRQAAASPSRWTLVRTGVPAAAAAGAGPAPGLADTVTIRFAIGAARIHSLLRQELVDVAWPLPPGLLDLPHPAGYRLNSRPGRPERWLVLVFRADLPPTFKAPARHALAHGLDRKDVLARLGSRGTEGGEWFPGAGPFDYPARDAEQVRTWLERGRLGRSLHVGLGFAADREGGEVARAVQAGWARFALDAELQPMRGAELAGSRLAPVGPAAELVEHQPLLEDPEATLAAFVMPLRDAPVGAVRTGWRTREFDPWIGPRPGRAPLDPVLAQQRMAEERVVLPLARLPWLWLEREAGPHPLAHPRFGPEPGRLAAVPVRPK